MIRSILAVFFLVFVAVLSSAAQDAVTPAQPSVTCCRVRAEGLDLTPDRATIIVRWLRSDDTVAQERGFEVTDGDPAIVEDNFLSGTGLAGQPTGLMRRLGSYVTDETGTLRQRYNKAVLRWLQTVGRIGASEYTIP